MNFKEACDQVGYNPDYSKAPERIYKYFAYKDGQTFECSSKEEALKISSLVDQVLVNKDEIDQYAKNRNALLNKAIQLWQESLRQKHSEVPDYVYNLCYQRAYESNHAYGYDEVASTLKDEIEFALKLLNHNS